MNQPCTEQNFIPKKKKKPNQTNVNLLCKQEEILSRGKKKVGCWMKKGNFVQHTSSSFSFLFSSHFGEIEFCWARRENKRHHFSLPLPLSTKHPFYSFSLLFSTLFYSILPKIHPTKHTLSVYIIERVLNFS